VLRFWPQPKSEHKRWVSTMLPAPPRLPCPTRAYREAGKVDRQREPPRRFFDVTERRALRL
jgi:hypothetical protein